MVYEIKLLGVIFFEIKLFLQPDLVFEMVVILAL